MGYLRSGQKNVQLTYKFVNKKSHFFVEKKKKSLIALIQVSLSRVCARLELDSITLSGQNGTFRVSTSGGCWYNSRRVDLAESASR